MTLLKDQVFEVRPVAEKDTTPFGEAVAEVFYQWARYDSVLTMVETASGSVFLLTACPEGVDVMQMAGNSIADLLETPRCQRRFDLHSVDEIVVGKRMRLDFGDEKRISTSPVTRVVSS